MPCFIVLVVRNVVVRLVMGEDGWQEEGREGQVEASVPQMLMLKGGRAGSFHFSDNIYLCSSSIDLL
jgi:hypothetical protein